MGTSSAPNRPSAAALRSLGRQDPVLGRAMAGLPTFPGFPEAGPRLTHYESLARAIVYQQLSGKAAGTIWGRVCALTPGSRFPKTAEVLELAPEALRERGLSWAKVRSVKDLAERIEDRRLVLHGVGKLDDEAVIERLVDVRGIGVWSAQMFLMFRLGRLDVMPSADLGVQEGLRLLDGLEERPTAKELGERGAAWAPLRSVGAWLMWRLVEAERGK